MYLSSARSSTVTAVMLIAHWYRRRSESISRFLNYNNDYRREHASSTMKRELQICYKRLAFRLESLFEWNLGNLNRARACVERYNFASYEITYLVSALPSRSWLIKAFYVRYSSLIHCYNVPLKEMTRVRDLRSNWSYQVFFVCITTEKVDSPYGQYTTSDRMGLRIQRGKPRARRGNLTSRGEGWTVIPRVRGGKIATKLKQRENSPAVQIIRR